MCQKRFSYELAQRANSEVLYMFVGVSITEDFRLVGIIMLKVEVHSTHDHTLYVSSY